MYDGELGKKRIAFIGAGIIAEVFITRMIDSKAVMPISIMATDVNPTRLKEIEQKFGIRTSGDNKAAADFGDIVVIAVPSGIVKAVLSESCQSLDPSQLLISFAAAVPTWLIEAALFKPVPVIRVIPNTPSMIGCGLNPYCTGNHTSEQSMSLAKDFLNLFGDPVSVEEKSMNAYTALTAIGPTYFFPIVKALREVSVKLGLDASEAQTAAALTMSGAAELVLKTGRHPEDLNLMISTRTMNEESLENIFSQALTDAYAKVDRLEGKLTQ